VGAQPPALFLSTLWCLVAAMLLDTSQVHWAWLWCWMCDWSALSALNLHLSLYCQGWTSRRLSQRTPCLYATLLAWRQ